MILRTRAQMVAAGLLAALLAGCGATSSGALSSAAPPAPSPTPPIAAAPAPTLPIAAGPAPIGPLGIDNPQPTVIAPTIDPAPGGVIGSDAQLITPAPGGDSGMVGGMPAQPGLPGAPGAPVEGAPPMQTPSSWLRFEEPTYGFAISYPDSYVVLEEIEAPQQIVPNLLRQVRFQDRALAAGPLAQIEPPQFAIHVFDNAAGLALDAWLDANESAGDRQPVAVAGRAGFKLTLPTALAPNQFYYVAAGTQVYRLTPLGAFAPEMLAGFSLR